MSVNIFGDGTQIINSASAQLGNTAVRTFTRTLGNILNDAVNICQVTINHGACIVDLNVVQSETNNSICKTYRIPIQYNSTSGGWRRVASLNGTGGYNGNDFEVDVSSGTGTATLRLVRTLVGPSPSGANITCSLQISQSSANVVTIVDTSTATSGVTNTGLYAYTPISIASGRAGIGTSNPTEVLQVVGKAYVDTQILGNSNDSATIPSFSFKEDSNTGMFHPSTLNTLGFATAGTERMRILADGSVGIGTTAPGVACDVTGSVRASSQLISTVAMGTAPLAVTSSNLVTNLNADFLDGQTSAYYLNPANLSAAVAVNKGGTGQTTLTGNKVLVGSGTNAVLTPTNLHWDSNNNRLGVNTSAPGHALHVIGSTRVEGNLTVNGTMTMVDTNTSTTEQLSITNDGTGPAVIVNQTGAQPIMRLQDDGVTVFELADGGNLGLGTTAPNEKLDVMAKGRFMTSGVTDSLILQNTDSNSGARANILFLTSSNSTQYELGTRNTVGNPNNAFYLYAKNIGGTAVNAYRMVIDESGNMGLGGITAPGQKLDVTGSIRASSQLISTVATGTAPLAVSSTTLVTNLNADLLDGLQNTSFFRSDAANSVDVRFASGNGRGMRFWDSDAYKIFMSAATDATWGGRVAGETTSDYNLYFRIGGGTNRGFVFQNGSTSTVGFDASGNIRCTGHIDAGTQFYGNSADTSNAPGYTWDGNTTVGMYRPAADTIGFTTGGVERLRITSGGSVGVGTTSVSARLHIVGGTSFGSETSTRIDHNTCQLLLVSRDANPCYIGTSTSHAFGLVTNNAFRLSVDASGNVGIGNTTPSNLFIVQNLTQRTDTITATLPVTFVPDMVINRRHGTVSTSGLTYPGPALSFRAFNGSATWDTGTIMGAVDGLNGTNTSGGLFFYTAAGGQPGGYLDGRNAGGAQSLALALGFNQNVYMPGNVGIGKSNPAFNLDINGTLNAGATTTTSVTSTGVISAGTGTAATQIQLTNSEIKMRGDGARHFSIYNTSSQFTLRDTSANSALGTAGYTFLTYDGATSNITIPSTTQLNVNGNLKVDGHWYWSPIKNIYCTATAINQDFTIDLINQGTYTGCTWQVWSDRSNTSVICARGDTYNVGIYNAVPDCRLVVNGTMKVHDGTTGVPAVGTNGGAGTRIVLWPGSGTEVPYGLGINGSTMWRSVPSVAIHSWYIATTEQMRLNTTGLGIGTTAPSYKLHVNGDIYATSDIYAFSDCNYKENIYPIPNALDKVSQLTGYTYSWKDDSNHKIHAGLLAQEVEKVLPEVINHDQDGKKSVAYGNVVALLIQAMNEQNKKIEAQQQTIESLVKRIEALESSFRK